MNLNIFDKAYYLILINFSIFSIIGSSALQSICENCSDNMKIIKEKQRVFPLLNKGISQEKTIFCRTTHFGHSTHI